jgi:hypothetical protein
VTLEVVRQELQHIRQGLSRSPVDESANEAGSRCPCAISFGQRGIAVKGTINHD